MKEWKDMKWCPFCQKETLQEFCDLEHERDGSRDSIHCSCGATWMGMTGKYSKKIKGIYYFKEEYEKA